LVKASSFQHPLLNAAHQHQQQQQWMAKTAQKAIAKWHKNWSMAKGEAIEDGASSIGARSSQLGEIGGGGGCGGQEIDDEHCAGKTTDVGNLAGGQKVNCK